MENPRKKLTGKSFKVQNLVNADFSGTDLRGADFTGSVLANANFSNSKTGLKTSSTVLVFIFALVVSLLSGYLAMLAGATIQLLINSGQRSLIDAGYITSGLILFFIVFTILKGGKNILLYIAFTIIMALAAGLVGWLSGMGTGMGGVYGSLALILFVLMIIVGTIARTVAGTLSSNIIFLVVALGGGMFSKNLGGGLGTVVLALSCAVISKRIISGKGNFPVIKKIALSVGAYFGTSFRNADLTGSDFSGSIIYNTDFTGAKLSEVNWENSKKKFSLIDE
jgi:hypothetical protein